MNDHLYLSTVLLTMYDGRTRLASQVAEEVRQTSRMRHCVRRSRAQFAYQRHPATDSRSSPITLRPPVPRPIWTRLLNCRARGRAEGEQE